MSEPVILSSQVFQNSVNGRAANKLERDLHQTPANESANETEALLLFVEYPDEEVTRIFTHYIDRWHSSDTLRYKVEFIRNVAIANKLYRLTWQKVWSPFLKKLIPEQKFSVSDCKHPGKESYLIPPPNQLTEFDMCKCDANNLYVYDNFKIFLYYNPEVNKWFPLSMVNWSADLFGGYMAAMDNRLYVVGRGRNGDARAQVYDVRAQRWEQIPGPFLKKGATNICAYLGKIYVSGHDEFFEERKTDVYDPIAGKWERFILSWPFKNIITDEGIELVSYKSKLWFFDSRNQNCEIYYDARSSEWNYTFALSEAVLTYHNDVDSNVVILDSVEVSLA